MPTSNKTMKFRPGLAAVGLLFTVLSLIGINWGLPSRKIDPHLFGPGEPWPGQKIFELADADRKLDPGSLARVGADVDVDPMKSEAARSIRLTGTERDIARIYLRYRLYTYQPDEMITMMALAGMNPSELHFDPRLYQYGGLFIYPVGLLIRLCGWLGLVDVRGDVVYYLDHPDEFGKFYLVARIYSALWGLLGVFVVFAIARHLPDSLNPLERTSDSHFASNASQKSGLLAALMYTLLPVVVCMSHEGKPHLPGAVLMLAAVLFAMRSVAATPNKTNGTGCDAGSARDFWRMCLCCGGSVGMVLSSWPIVVLIPWSILRRHRTRGEAGETYAPKPRILRSALLGGGLALAAYVVTNPYVVINLFVRPDLLRSNFGNSLAMYEVRRIGEGLLRVIELTVEGATLPVVVFGVIGLGVALARRSRAAPALMIPAALFFLQFVLIGAGKPAEYGRFGVFTNVALIIAAVTWLSTVRAGRACRIAATLLVALWVAGNGARYLWNFHVDTTEDASRLRVARNLAFDLEAVAQKGTPNRWPKMVCLSAEPAPYGCPPMPFHRIDVRLIQDPAALDGPSPPQPMECVFVGAVDRPPANVVTASRHGDPATTVKGRRLDDRLRDWTFLQAPISWANKPFEIRPCPGAGGS